MKRLVLEAGRAAHGGGGHPVGVPPRIPGAVTPIQPVIPSICSVVKLVRLVRFRLLRPDPIIDESYATGVDGTEGHAVVHAQWADVTGPPPAHQEESARAYGALRRRRHISAAATLPRLARGYAMCDGPLPITAASEEKLGLGNLAHVAILQRLRGCGPWLGRLAGQWLQGNKPW